MASMCPTKRFNMEKGKYSYWKTKIPATSIIYNLYAYKSENLEKINYILRK